MFDRIARRYDLVNTLLSGGTDQGWRRKAAAATEVGGGGRARDVACGSGRLSAELLARGAAVVGLDQQPPQERVVREETPQDPVHISLGVPLAGFELLRQVAKDQQALGMTSGHVEQPITFEEVLDDLELALVRQTDSQMDAMPWPTPMHIVARP